MLNKVTRFAVIVATLAMFSATAIAGGDCCAGKAEKATSGTCEKKKGDCPMKKKGECHKKDKDSTATLGIAV